MTTSATMPMTRSAEKPMSNMFCPENKKAPAGALCLCRTSNRGSGLRFGLALDLALDRLAAHLRSRRLRLVRAAFAHAVLEAAHRAAKIRAHVAQLLGAENEHHDQENDQPVPDAERAHVASLPISLPLLFPALEHATEWLGTAQHVHMYMIHLLMPHRPRVDDAAKALAGARFTREPARDRKHLSERRDMGRLRLVQRRDVHLGNDEKVHRRLRADVVEGDDVVVVMDFPGWNLAPDDLAKNAIRVVHFLRAAFSSRPEMPSRRCSSASTSPGPRPWRASTIMLWNHRSATSRTRCRRSPLFAASTVSVASSPIFFSSASSPSESSFAT